MFDFFRKHTRVLQFLLVILIFPSFVFFGIQGYSGFTGDANDSVAKVAGQNITRTEWEGAQRDQMERVRQQMPNVDPKLFDTPEMKLQSLDGLVRQRVMLAAADKLNLVTTDDRLQRVFAADAQFAFMRNPDGSVNKDVLSAQGMSSELFAQRLRQDLTLRQVMLGVAGTAFAPVSTTAAALDAMFQQREVQVQRFETKASLEKVSPTDADIEKFYKDPANALQFQAPEQASVEYVVLDLDTLKKGISVSEEDLRKHYTENEQRYTTPEERRASHILIKAEKGAPEADRAKAKAKAEALLADLKKNPAAFAETARKNSEDPGSAEKGGDLDFFGRGAMVKPFEDAAFGLKPEELSAVVESDFGYHIIKLAAVKGGEKRSFESVRAELEGEVKTQLAQKRFSEAAVEFTNMVYEQPDSLKPAADKFKLELRSAQNVKRSAAPGATGALANPKFLEALFGTDALRNKRNTEAVEIAPSTMVSGRVLQYAAAQQLPLAEVKTRVRERLATVQAAALARKLGEERLAALRAAPDTALTEPVLLVSRAQPREVQSTVLDALLKAPAATLPAFVGVDLGEQGYAVVKLNKVLGRDPVAADAAQGQTQYAQAWGDAESQAYYGALKSRFKVEIKADALKIADAAASAASAASK
ncbi:MAG: SurA N-terminal domain-containing protein [Burkholderiales bacterium]|nr:SurA N-terminal domain-containing protein [Burkholderiales bacterium]